ncbi:MAG: hypothetical protein IT360_15660 [Gemmatimonadaceae bacterium]|nr:hypothetical protein [Gemmatimonadaceae bacterium]
MTRDASALRVTERGRALFEARLHESELWQAIGTIAARVSSRPAAEPASPSDAIERARRVATYGERELPEMRYARGEVIDTGPGIDPETQRRLFEPRFTTEASGGSTALGLADARRLAREYGGDVRVHSVPGEGSRFELLLPAG